MFLDRFDLGPLAASRASAALGRAVSVAGLHVTPGRWLVVKAKGVRIANIPGGTRPDMATLGDATAEIDVLSLLQGPVVLRHVAVRGLSVLLERAGDDKRNWRFGGTPAGSGGNRRSGFPVLLDVQVKSSDITVRTTEGHMLQSRIDDGTLSTVSADAPVTLALNGAYHDTPVRLDAVLQPIAVLRDATIPYGTNIHIVSGETTLHFDGTMTKPLDVDGVRGTLTLHAPTLAPILAMTGAPGDAFKAALDLSGELTRSAAIWTLAVAAGQLNDSTVAPSLLRFADGGHAHPDDVTVDLAFEQMNLNNLLAGRGAGSGSSGPMQVERDPDPRLNLHLTAQRLTYSGATASDVALKAAVMPGRITVDEFDGAAFGARLQASGHAEAADKGARVLADASVTGVDVQQLRRLTGGTPVPIAGRLDAQAAADGAGATLDDALRAAHVAAVVWMTSGSISRDVIEKASLDIRRLFRKPQGMAPVSCLLGVFELRNGAGTVSPLRIRTADGTVAGQGVFDLARNRIDVTIGSQSSTTSAFALDVPVRISGNINDPDVQPSDRSVALAEADLTRLPPALRAVVQRNPCAR